MPERIQARLTELKREDEQGEAQLQALSDGGVAVVGSNADTHQLDNIPTVPVGADGLTLSMYGLSGALL
jgi:hypothetical protein